MRRRAFPALFALLASCSMSCSRPRVVPSKARIGVPYEVSTLDPHVENTVSNYAVLSNAYESLVATDLQMKIRPALASYWESPDPLTWVFHLRPGVLFHDGSPFEAADVVFSLNRLLTSRDLQMRSYLLDVAEVRALDRMTVQVRTTRSSRTFLNKLSFVLVLRRDRSRESLAERAVGTGPYSIQAWDQGRSLELLRNPRYWGETPTLAVATLVLGLSADQALAGISRREFDLVQANTRRLEEVVAKEPLYRVLRQETVLLKYVGMDLSREKALYVDAPKNPFRDARVRRALDLATDRRQLVSRIDNLAVPANQPISRNIFGFNPSLPPTRPDLAQARQLLAEAGFRDGFRATLHTRHLLSDVATLIREQWALLGLDLRLEVLADKDFFPLSRGGSSLWISRRGSVTGDAAEFLESVVHTNDPEHHLGVDNNGGFSDPELDLEIVKASEVQTESERLAILQQLIARVAAQRIWIPLYVDQDGFALDRSLDWRPRADSYIRVSEIHSATP